MQVVGLDADAAVGFDRAAAALAGVVRERGSVGIVRTGQATPSSDDDIVVTVDDGTTTVTYPPGAAGIDAIDRLADDGVDYAVVDASLAASWTTIAVADAPVEEALTTVSPAAIESGDLGDVVDIIDGLEPYETLGSLVDAIQAHPDSPKGGALATFTGRVRAENYEDHRTTHLEYEKYEDVADAEMAAICDELTDREGVYEVLMHHNTGVVPAEADAVHVVVLAGHRREAFAAVEDGIDLLKDRVPIFKKEVTESGEHWAHDRP